MERLAPWHHRIALPHGLTTVPGNERRPIDRRRVDDLRRFVWPRLDLAGKRVLDVGCNCGGFSIEAERSGASHVLGIDPTPKYIEQAEFLKDVLDPEHVEFRRATVEELAPEEFDVTLCFGLLYHLENPVGAMRRLAAMTTEVIAIETALAPAGAGQSFWRMDILEPVSDDDRIASTGLWRTERVCQLFPTAKAVTDLMGFLGFEVERLDPPPGLWRPFYDGRRAVYLARPAGAPGGR